MNAVRLIYKLVYKTDYDTNIENIEKTVSIKDNYITATILINFQA